MTGKTGEEVWPRAAKLALTRAGSIAVCRRCLTPASGAVP